jgi:hypothetical protein
MPMPHQAYFLPGRGEPLTGPIGVILNDHALSVQGRELSSLSGRFAERLSVIRSDLVSHWHREALLVGHSFGAYLLLHTLADLRPFPGTVLLLSPVLGTARSADGRYASRPPRADRLLTLAAARQFAPPARLAMVTGAEDLGCDPAIAQRFASLISTATCEVVAGVGHRLPVATVRATLAREIDAIDVLPNVDRDSPPELDIVLPERRDLLEVIARPLAPPPLPAAGANDCPSCGSSDVARIFYGLRRPWTPLPPDSVDGGCCVFPGCPDRKCRRCGTRWYHANRATELSS